MFVCIYKEINKKEKKKKKKTKKENRKKKKKLIICFALANSRRLHLSWRQPDADDMCWMLDDF